MFFSLSSDHFNQLVPLLGSLARLLADRSQLTEGELHTLLLGADLEDSPAALEELRRWGRLLKPLQQASDEARRRATVEALIMRGLPEAAVLLAVATVAGSSAAPMQVSDPSHASSTPSSPTRLIASVASLDFGSLGSGQQAALEFDVWGGPGQVSVESDQVQVTPGQFGAEPTRLRVELRPLASGLLWTSLKLVTAGETLELPVVAQWQGGEAAPARLLLDSLTQSPQSVAAPLEGVSRQPLPLGVTQYTQPVQPVPVQSAHVPGSAAHPLNPQPQPKPWTAPQPSGYMRGTPTESGSSPAVSRPPTPTRPGPGASMLMILLIIACGVSLLYLMRRTPPAESIIVQGAQATTIVITAEAVPATAIPAAIRSTPPTITSPTFQPTVVPSPPPTIPPPTIPPALSPMDTIISYWNLVSFGEYQRAWNHLTPYFRQLSHSNSFDAYIRGFQDWQLCRVDVVIDDTVQQGSTATVNARMQFVHGQSCEISNNQPLFYNLVQDTQGSWLIDSIIAGSVAPGEGTNHDDGRSESIRAYWQLVIAGQYEEAWNRLSPGFQQVSHSNSFAAYVQGLSDWRLCAAEVEIIAVRSDVVTTRMHFQAADGCSRQTSLVMDYYLVSNNGRWLIEQAVVAP